MADFVRMNRQAVRQTGLSRRTIRQTDGPPLEEVELVVILRGGMAHRAFLALIEGGDIAFEIPEVIRLRTTVTASTWSSSGSGDAASFRHELTLRETAASAEARAAEGRAAALRAEAEADDEAVEAVGPEDVDSHPTGPADFSHVGIGGGGAGWATALRPMTGRDETKTAPEAPLAPGERPASRRCWLASAGGIAGSAGAGQFAALLRRRRHLFALDCRALRRGRNASGRGRDRQASRSEFGRLGRKRNSTAAGATRDREGCPSARGH